MLNEPHYPSKWSVAAVFAVIVLLMVGVFAWAFYFNFGTVKVSADRNFVLEVNGESHPCSTSCEVKLPPKIYDALATSEGHYEEKLVFDVTRWGTVEREISFQLIPFLKAIEVSEVPPDEPKAYFQTRGNRKALYVRNEEGERLVTEFESLKDPRVTVAGKTGVVTDSGRLFFVDLESGRKIQKFDETTEVRAASISDDGKRILLFISMNGGEVLWVWDNETSQVSPLNWYESSDLVQWDFGVSHRLFVVTNKLVDEAQSSVIEEVFQSVDQEKPVALYRYNLDSGKAQQVATFEEKKPVKLFRHTDRYFVEYEGGAVEELVVR